VCSTPGHVAAPGPLVASLLPEPGLPIPRGSAHLAPPAQGLLHPPRRPAPHPAVPVSSLSAVLQFTDLLHHLLAQTPRPPAPPLRTPRRLLRLPPDRPRPRRPAPHRPAPDRAPGPPLPALPRAPAPRARPARARRRRRLRDLRG